MIEADLGRIITSKKYASGTIYISDLTNNMWAVTVLDRDNIVISSRTFAFSDKTEKTVWESCRSYYKKVKECVFQRKLELIDALEDL
jgi:hypothetical protein